VSSTLAHRYAPRGGCLALFAHRGPEVLVSGPAGTGKSRACLEKLHACMLSTPGARGLIVRKTAESLTTTALVTWREHVVAEALSAGLVTFYGGSAEEPAQYRYSNGSAVMIGGMNKATRIMSTEYDMIYVQEAIELSLTDWEALTTRLRNGRMSFQQLLADTNPDRPTHWLNHRCATGRTTMIESRHSDNPRYVGEDGQPTEAGAAYLAILDGLTGPRRLRLRDGLWVAAEGQVYAEYDPAVHLLDWFPIPETWPRFWGVDFGFRHPFVCSMWAEAPDGELYRYREIYGTGRTVEDWAVAILDAVREPVADDPDTWTPAHWRWKEPKPEAIVCDHDAEGRVVLERRLGLSTRAAHKKVNEGIDAVKQRLADRRLFLLRGVLVEPDAELAELHKPTCTEEELPGYRWDERKEQPVKIEDDGCDTMRYVVAHRDLAGRSSVRF
jgi:phage terminase large subunit